MKKSVILTLAALAALMAASCQKEETGRILTATFEQYDHNSKAYINDEYYACWENGDAVSINGNQYLINIENTTATIAAPTSDNLMAFYPADGVTDLTSTGGTVTLQHTQTYTESNGHQVIDNPMAAYCPEGSNELRFRNLCALLKVTIVGNTSVKGIQVKGIDNQMLWGEAQLMLNNQNQPVLTSFTNGSNSVMLNFTTAVAISGSKSFYIVVPAKSDFENLTIAVLTTDDINYANNSKTSLIGQALLRNQIGAISYTPAGDEDATFTPDWMIRYTATENFNGSTSGTYGSTYKSKGFDNGNGYLLFDGPVTTIPNGNSAMMATKGYFQQKAALTSIDLPASVTSIGNYAFQNCICLANINLPASLNSIGSSAFTGCNSLTSINLPASLNSIGASAFMGCSSLTSINLPASLTSIGTYAFRNCSSLTSINLPANLTSIGNYVFDGCSGLTSINLPANLTSIGNCMFQNCSSLTSINLPANLTSIGDHAFDGCRALTSINLPASLNSIGTYAFSSCSSLTSINLPASLTSIGTYAFMGCSSLTSITLPASLTSIGTSTFSSCVGLTSITLPASLNSIGNSAFLGCSSLVRVDCHSTTPPTLGTKAFSGILTASAVLHVPSGHGSDYSDWSGYFQGGIVEDL